MPDDAHTHDHGQTHDDGHEHEGALAARRQRSLEDALVAAGIVGLDDVDTVLDMFLADADPANGAHLIARSWLDPDFRRLLLDDGNRAVEELGMSVSGPHTVHRFRAVEDSPERHNLVTCTLCSCYPMALLGPSPGWYRSFEYRARSVREPRTVLAEFGVDLGDDVDVDVWDSTAEIRYLVVPERPAGTEDLNEGQLAELVTRAGMIGAAWV